MNRKVENGGRGARSQGTSNSRQEALHDSSLKWCVHVDGRGWEGIGMLENQAEWPRTVFSRASTFSFSVLSSREPRAPGPGKGVLAHERPPSWTRLTCRSLCPGSCAQETHEEPPRDSENSHKCNNQKLPRNGPPSQFPLFSKTRFRDASTNYPGGCGPWPNYNQERWAWSALRPYGQSAFHSLSDHRYGNQWALLLGCPALPESANLTTSSNHELFWDTEQPTAPAGVACGCWAWDLVLAEWNCWNAAPLCRRTGWNGGGARLEAGLSGNLANHVESP